MAGLTDRLASRAGYALTVLIGAAASGGCAIAASQPWVRGSASVRGLPPIEATVDGADIAPLAAALAIVCLAGFGAVIATRGAVRRAVGALVAVCAAVVAVLALVPGSTGDLIEEALAAKGWTGGSYESAATAWRVVTVVAAAFVLAAAAVVARVGAHWSSMGARYDSPSESRRHTPAAGRPVTGDAWWRALDEGDDPTRDD